LGDTFEIITLNGGLGDGAITGEFDAFLLPTLASELAWGIQYHLESVVLEILAPRQADIDGDGDIDGGDFLAIQRTNSSLIPQWQTEYGSQIIVSSLAASTAASTTVPEPTTLALALLAFAAYGQRPRCWAFHPGQ